MCCAGDLHPAVALQLPRNCIPPLQVEMRTPWGGLCGGRSATEMDHFFIEYSQVLNPLISHNEVFSSSVHLPVLRTVRTWFTGAPVVFAGLWYCSVQEIARLFSELGYYRVLCLQSKQLFSQCKIYTDLTTICSFPFLSPVFHLHLHREHCLLPSDVLQEDTHQVTSTAVHTAVWGVESI